MAGQPKKSFNVYQNTLKAGLTAMKKYSDTSRRGFLVIVQDNTGLHKFGTKNLVEQFQKTKSCQACCGWEDAAKVDTKDLNSENSDDISDVSAKASISNHILADVYMGGDVPKLPFDVDIMSEKEAADWILPELKKDLVENGAKPVSRIVWGDPNMHPKCWADDVAEWEKVTNIRKSQKNKLGVPIVDALKATIKNRLRQKGIDPKEHIITTCDQKKALRKQKVRGLHKVDMEIPVVIEEVPVEKEGTLENLENVEKEATIENLENVNDNSAGLDSENCDYVEPLLDEQNESIDASFERDDDGRRVLPSRCLSDRLPSSSGATDSTPSASESPISVISAISRSHSTTETTAFIPISKRARNLDSDESEPRNWSRGRGKGGLNLRVLGGRITKETSKADKQKELRIMWKQWLKGYTEEINEIIKNNPRGLHIKCDDCNKNVAKQSYLRHRTVNGCASINPKIKFYNWCS